MEVIRIEALKSGIKIDDTENEAERFLERGEILEFTRRRDLTYNGISLRFQSASDYNAIQLAYTAPMDDAFFFTRDESTPQATNNYEFGSMPGMTSFEFGRPEGLVVATYLGHTLRDTASTLFNPEQRMVPLEDYTSKDHPPSFFVPIGPIIHSDNLYGLRSRSYNLGRNLVEDGFAGEARFYVQFGSYNKTSVTDITLGFATLSDQDKLVRIKTKKITGNAYSFPGDIKELGMRYATRLVELGAFLDLITANPQYFPKLQEIGFNLDLLDIFVEPDRWDDSYEKEGSPYYKRDTRARAILLQEGINWEQTLKDLPDTTDDVLKLDDLMCTLFQKSQETPVK